MQMAQLYIPRSKEESEQKMARTRRIYELARVHVRCKNGAFAFSSRSQALAVLARNGRAQRRSWRGCAVIR